MLSKFTTEDIRQGQLSEFFPQGIKYCVKSLGAKPISGPRSILNFRGSGRGELRVCYNLSSNLAILPQTLMKSSFLLIHMGRAPMAYLESSDIEIGQRQNHCATWSREDE